MIKWLIHNFAKALVYREINKIKKDKGKDFKKLDKEVQNLKAMQEQLDSELDVYCRLYPDSPLCKNRGKKMKW